ncbi:MAG: glycoside hydrolase family 3 C-terminal domain-containing protein [Ignavibacteriales bacterium]|nr:glycoside hydrolase family 3 C-terminal domain-containing protein [Ignavibacteriales bacterium]
MRRILSCIYLVMVTAYMNADAQQGSWVESTLASMTLEEKIGQLFAADLVAVYSNRESPSFQLAKEFVHKYHVGGFILAGGTVSDIALVTNALQRESKLPLLISADLEGGLWFNHPYRWLMGRGPELPRFVGGGGTPLPSCMAVGATGNTHFAYEFGRITAREARAVGIHWINAPVADVNSNPHNPIVNTRSFGEDPAQVAAMVEAYVRGAQEEKVIATLKHFPGHGDTEEDTHMQLPSLPFDRARLDAVEFVPFKAGINAGVQAVMTAHIALPNVDPEKRPSTLSPVIVTELLRNHLGFKGLVVTDGMTMQGVTDHFSAAEAAIRAIEAGDDVVLVPADFAQAYNGVLGAVRSGRISLARVEESVRRVLAAKVWVGIDRARTVNVENISNIVAPPESERIADSMFSAAVTLLRNQGNVLPLSPAARVLVVTVTDEPNLQIGDALASVLKTKHQSVALSHVWNESSPDAISRIIAEAQTADIIVAGIYLSVGAWKGQLGFSPELRKFFDKLSTLKKPVVTIAFGDPYVIEKLPTTDVIIATYTGVRKAEEAAANVLLGKSEVKGKLPVTIPGKFTRGDGIHLTPIAR